MYVIVWDGLKEYKRRLPITKVSVRYTLKGALIQKAVCFSVSLLSACVWMLFFLEQQRACVPG